MYPPLENFTSSYTQQYVYTYCMYNTPAYHQPQVSSLLLLSPASHHHQQYTMSRSFRFLTPLGIIVLLHSAYSCLHYRSIISSSALEDFLVEKGYSESSPPQDVVIEVILGFLFCLFGQVSASGNFLPVVGTGRIELRAPAHVSRDFDLFCTRARIVADAKNKFKTRS